MIEFFDAILEFQESVFFVSNARQEVTKQLTPSERLAILQRFANIRVIPADPSLSDKRLERRIHNEFVKKNPLFSLCFVCQSLATVRHHIIQLQHGGLTVGKNLVPLCNYCHAEIHPWLKEDQPYPKPAIDWDSPFQSFQNHYKSFYEWLLTKKNAKPPLCILANSAARDLNFPHKARHLHVFLNYYDNNPEMRKAAKSAHAAWRKTRPLESELDVTSSFISVSGAK